MGGRWCDLPDLVAASPDLNPASCGPPQVPPPPALYPAKHISVLASVACQAGFSPRCSWLPLAAGPFLFTLAPYSKLLTSSSNFKQQAGGTVSSPNALQLQVCEQAAQTATLAFPGIRSAWSLS